MLRDYLISNYKEDVESAMATAEDAIKQRFIFNQRWDMERTYVAETFDGEINFMHQPGGDPEWVYAFNRLKHFISLGEAYLLTEDEKYAECFASQVALWIKNVRPDDPGSAKAWRTIESGIRLDTFVKSYLLMRTSKAFSRVENDFMSSIAEHAEFIIKNAWNSYHLMSNWGVLANHGLYTAACVFNRPDWQKEALFRLSKELQNEVYDDGMQWEQSPMYHNEVLREYLDVVLFSDIYGYELEPWFRNKVHSMARAAMCFIKPDGSEPMMGDSDDINMKDLLTYSAYVFMDGEIKSVAFPHLDFETSFIVGEEGIRRYDELEAVPPSSLDFFLSESGNGFSRTGWGDKDSYLRFHAGTLGAGHGHSDQTHISFVNKGKDFLVDAGRYTYVFDAGRKDFKDARAHNIVIVDNTECYPEKDSWECLSLNKAVNIKAAFKGEAVAFEGGHLGYISSGVFVNRRVLWLKKHEVLVVIDGFYAKGRHDYESLFHFREGLEPEIDGNTAIVENVRITQISVFPVSLSVVPSHISRHYNQKEVNKALSTEFSAEDFVSLWTIFDFSNDKADVRSLSVGSNFKGITFTHDTVESIEIVSKERNLVVVSAHKEYASPTDTFLSGGCTGFGSLTYFDRMAGETEIGTRLFV